VGLVTFTDAHDLPPGDFSAAAAQAVSIFIILFLNAALDRLLRPASLVHQRLGLGGKVVAARNHLDHFVAFLLRLGPAMTQLALGSDDAPAYFVLEGDVGFFALLNQ
jgi:hypothetical protein